MKTDNKPQAYFWTTLFMIFKQVSMKNQWATRGEKPLLTDWFYVTVCVFSNKNARLSLFQVDESIP